MASLGMNDLLGGHPDVLLGFSTRLDAADHLLHLDGGF